MVGEGDQVPAEAESLEHRCSRTHPSPPWNPPAGVNYHNQLVPLRAVADRQLDLTQREVPGPGATAQTQSTQQLRSRT